MAAIRRDPPRPAQRRDWRVPRAKVDREGVCRVCHRPGRLEAAHIIPRSLGGTEEEHATVPLCRGCHSEFDAHTLDLLPHLTRDEQAHAVRLVGMASAWRTITGQRLP